MGDIKDTYLSIKSPAEGEYKEKGSKFICLLRPLSSEEEFEEFLNNAKSLHSKARHHCYAYRLGLNAQTYRFNDDGEPSGTAGRPILSQLKSNELTNLAAIVIRYFGGTKLGASGLANAYKESTKAALNNVRFIRKTVEKQFIVHCRYEDLPILMEAIKFADIKIVEKEFKQKPSLHLSMPLSEIKRKWKVMASKFIGHNASLEDLRAQHVEILEGNIEQ
jgi:uncharacterized YigZ family protein